MITNGRLTAALAHVLVGAVLTLGAVACGSADVPATESTAAYAAGGGLATTTAAPTPTPAPTTAPSPTAPVTTAPVTRAPVPKAPATTVAPKATPQPTPKATPKPAAAGSSTQAQVVALTNDAREQAGCSALTTDARLTKAAQGHSDDMAANDYFDHDSQDGRTFDVRIENAGYPDPGGENIARGQRSAAEVVQAWLDSPGHRRNIEDCSFTTIGVGFAPDGDYWTQDFGR